MIKTASHKGPVWDFILRNTNRWGDITDLQEGKMGIHPLESLLIKKSRLLGEIEYAGNLSGNAVVGMRLSLRE